MVPEQAGNWAYPQPEMSDEAIAFCLANGMLGRMYLSGHLDRMSSSQLALVIEATRAHKMMRPMLFASAPGWPLGLPDWRAADVAYQLAAPSVLYLTVWSRTDDAREISLDLPAFVGSDVEIQTIFPTSLPPWDWNWMSDTGQLHLGKPQGEPGARVLCLRAKR
jgi:alpha-galactosidase